MASLVFFLRGGKSSSHPSQKGAHQALLFFCSLRWLGRVGRPCVPSSRSRATPGGKNSRSCMGRAGVSGGNSTVCTGGARVCGGSPRSRAGGWTPCTSGTGVRGGISGSCTGGAPPRGPCTTLSFCCTRSSASGSSPCGGGSAVRFRCFVATRDSGNGKGENVCRSRAHAGQARQQTGDALIG